MLLLSIYKYDQSIHAIFFSFKNRYFFNPRREVLNEQLAQVVEGLEFAGLKDRQMNRRSEQLALGDMEVQSSLFYSPQSPPDPSSPVWSAHGAHAGI